MTGWFVVVVSGVLTYLLRGSFLFLGDRVQLPGWAAEALRYVAPAAFAAIAVPATLGPGGISSLFPPTAAVVAVVAGAGAVAYRRNIPTGLIVGLGCYGLATAVGL